jgi:hypothetical protein
VFVCNRLSVLVVRATRGALMKAGKSGSRGLALAALVSCLALVGCGGGEDSGFPSLATAYGTGEWVGEDGRFVQTYTMNDGEVAQYTVTGRITIDAQSDGTWTGTVFRCERPRARGATAAERWPAPSARIAPCVFL